MNALFWYQNRTLQISVALLYNSNFWIKSNDLDTKQPKAAHDWCVGLRQTSRSVWASLATNVPKRFDSMCLGLLANTSVCNRHGAEGQLSAHPLTVYHQSLYKPMREHQFGTLRFVLCWWMKLALSFSSLHWTPHSSFLCRNQFPSASFSLLALSRWNI